MGALEVGGGLGDHLPLLFEVGAFEVGGGLGGRLPPVLEVDPEALWWSSFEIMLDTALTFFAAFFAKPAICPPFPPAMFESPAFTIKKVSIR